MSMSSLKDEDLDAAMASIDIDDDFLSESPAPPSNMDKARGGKGAAAAAAPKAAAAKVTAPQSAGGSGGGMLESFLFPTSPPQPPSVKAPAKESSTPPAPPSKNTPLSVNSSTSSSLSSFSSYSSSSSPNASRSAVTSSSSASSSSAISSASPLPSSLSSPSSQPDPFDGLLNLSLRDVSRYHSSGGLSSYSHSASEKKGLADLRSNIDAFDKVAGPPLPSDSFDSDGVFSSPVRSPPRFSLRHAASSGLLLWTSSVLKKGTVSVVKKTNARQLILTTEALIICKSVGAKASRGKRGSVASPAALTGNSTTSTTTTTTAPTTPNLLTSSALAAASAGPNPFDADDDDEDDDEEEGNDESSTAAQKASGKEGMWAPVLSGQNKLEFKQMELLSDLMVIDLSVNRLLSTSTGLAHAEDANQPAVRSANADSIGEDYDESGEGGGTGGNHALAAAPTTTKNPFAKIGQIFGGGKSTAAPQRSKRMSSVFEASTGRGARSGTILSPVHQGNGLTLPLDFIPDAVAAEEPVDQTDFSSFELVTPSRSYVFVCSSPAERRRWVSILSAAIVSAHKARELPHTVESPGWQHKVCRLGVCSAAVLGDLHLLRRSLQTAEGQASVDRRDESGYVPCHYAAMYGKDKVLALLLDSGADPNQLCAAKCSTPLIYACEVCSAETIRLLVSNGGDANSRNVDGVRPIHALVGKAEKHHDATRLISLLKRCGANLNAPDGDGNTPLHICAARGFPRLIQALSNENVHVSPRRQGDGLTPLQLACAKPFAAVAAADDDGMPPMYNVEVLRNLIGIGAPVNLPASVGDGTPISALQILMAGMYGQLLVPAAPAPESSTPPMTASERGRGQVAASSGPKQIIDESWAFRICLGIVELLKSGARIDEKLMAMLPPSMIEICKSGADEWKEKQVDLHAIVKYTNMLLTAVDKKRWVADNASDKCLLCDGLFTAANRRHHCRLCGTLACGLCTGKKLPVGASSTEQNPKSKEEKVCDCCYNKTSSLLAELQQNNAERNRAIAKMTAAAHRAANGVDEDEDESDEEDRVRADLFRGAAKSSQDKKQGQGVGGANSALGEAMQNMGERGEKLAALNYKSSDMQNQAKQFRDMTAALKQSQQKKNNMFGW